MDGSGYGMIMSYLPIILVFAVFYFLIIRPQSQQARQHDTMLAALKRGDKVVTSGGIMGKIEATHGANILTLKINTEDTITLLRAAVERLATDDEVNVLDDALKGKK